MFVGEMSGRAERTGFPGLVFDLLLTEEDLHMSADAVAELLGDENAKVTVSSDRADKHMGSGTSVFCSVTLTCHQDAETILEAQELAGHLVLEFLPEMAARAEEVWASPTEEPKPEPENKGSGKRRRRSHRKG